MSVTLEFFSRYLEIQNHKKKYTSIQGLFQGDMIYCTC